MRLAFLHPTVFAAYAGDKLSDEQAFAYAATEDQALQLQTFQRLSKLRDWDHRPSDIRGAMKVGDNELQGLIGFVGIKAYEAAGGTFERNLFADKGNEGIVHDEELLRRLANEKLETTRAAAIAEYGPRGEITFVDRPPSDQYGSSYDFQVRTQNASPSEEQQLRLEAISTRTEEIEAVLDDEALFDDEGDPLPEHAERIEALEAEQEKLNNEWQDIHASLPEVVPEGPKLATLRIGTDGKPQVQLYWARRPRANAGGGGSVPGRAPSVDPAKEAGLSADSVQVMKSTYRTITQALIAMSGADGDPLALDFLLFSQTKACLNVRANYFSGQVSWSSTERGRVGLHDQPNPDRTMDNLEKEVAHQPAAAELDTLRSLIVQHAAFAHHDPVAGFELFQKAEPALKARCTGYPRGLRA
jgi:hypothetical protein